MARPRTNNEGTMNTIDLFNQPEVPHFDGHTYDPGKDHKRLTTQLGKVRAAMLDGAWHTLDELVARCGGTTASVSARLRDLRKKKHGGHTVERRRVKEGLWQYRVGP